MVTQGLPPLPCPLPLPPPSDLEVVGRQVGLEQHGVGPQGSLQVLPEVRHPQL
jgi:hypothetical protein